MADQDFTTTIYVNAGPEHVYDAINQPRRWWGTNLAGDAVAVGDELIHHVEGVHDARFRVTELVPNKRIVWTVLHNQFTFTHDKSEWTGNELRFDIESTAAGTQLTFTQKGLVPEYECYDICVPAWTFYITESLRDLIVTGTGKPTNFADPNFIREAQESVGGRQAAEG